MSRLFLVKKKAGEVNEKSKLKIPHNAPGASAPFLFDAIGPVADAENLDFDVGQSLIVKAELFGDRLGHVEHATSDKWPAIIATHDGGASIGHIGNSDFARQGKGFMRGRVGPWPEVLAGRCLSRKNKPTFIVVGGHAGLGITHSLSRGNRVIAPATHGIGLRLIAFDMRPHASREGKAHQQGNENSGDFFQDRISVFKRVMAAWRDAGMLPQ